MDFNSFAKIEWVTIGNSRVNFGNSRVNFGNFRVTTRNSRVVIGYSRVTNMTINQNFKDFALNKSDSIL